jgi:hypothetical protein
MKAVFSAAAVAGVFLSLLPGEAWLWSVDVSRTLMLIIPSCGAFYVRMTCDRVRHVAR